MEFSAFKKIVYGVCYEIGADVKGFFKGGITPNFHVAHVVLNDKIRFLLCSESDNWAFSEVFDENKCELKFSDEERASKALSRLYGICALSRKELLGPFTSQPYLLESDARYWKPETLGEGLFNWWD